MIRASKGFHRYTTRRKQGGSQSANDNAKGAASSAGAQIRRYNEQALNEDVKGLLKEWIPMMDQVELILVRASGQSSRKLLYDNGIDKNDPRLRGFPINTYRATQSEIMRVFLILSRLQVGVIEAKDSPKVPALPKPKVAAAKVEEVADPVMVQHSEKFLSLIRRNKILSVKEYASTRRIDLVSFKLEPKKAYQHLPSLLHAASSMSCGPMVKFFLEEGCDPTIQNDESQTPFEVAGSKDTRDVFRIWRHACESQHKLVDWTSARIPAALTPGQLETRKAKEAEQRSKVEDEEKERRKLELARLEAEAAEVAKAQADALEKRRGPGRVLTMSSSSSRDNTEGLTPEMKKKVEREKRARAAEARFGRK